MLIGRESSLAIIFLVLVALLYVPRLLATVEVTVGGTEIPLWLGVFGVLVPGALAYLWWREHRVGSGGPTA